MRKRKNLTNPTRQQIADALAQGWVRTGSKLTVRADGAKTLIARFYKPQPDTQ